MYIPLFPGKLTATEPEGKRLKKHGEKDQKKCRTLLTLHFFRTRVIKHC